MEKSMAESDSESNSSTSSESSSSSSSSSESGTSSSSSSCDDTQDGIEKTRVAETESSEKILIPQVPDQDEGQTDKAEYNGRTLHEKEIEPANEIAAQVVNDGDSEMQKQKSEDPLKDTKIGQQIDCQKLTAVVAVEEQASKQKEIQNAEKITEDDKSLAGNPIQETDSKKTIQISSQEEKEEGELDSSVIDHSSSQVEKNNTFNKNQDESDPPISRENREKKSEELTHIAESSVKYSSKSQNKEEISKQPKGLQNTERRQKERSRSPKRQSRSLSRDRHRRGRSYSRSRSRSRSHDRRRRDRRRSASFERRREERKRRHAEREAIELEAAKRQNVNEKISAVATEKDNETVSDPKAKITERQRRTVDLLTSRTGGAYIPPAKLRLMQAEITDKSSAAYQRIAWEALKKSIHGYINKVNVDNIAIITRELLKENIVRGRGLLCRSIIQAQAASPTFTHVYAALVSIINSKFPNIGELLLKRLVIQFKRAFRRNDKNVCLSSSRFIAHLVNQRVAHEILALEILTLLVETPTDDSVEVAIAFLKECGMKLTEVSSKGIGAIFEMLKNILHEGKLDKRVQYMIEVVFQVRKDGFKDHPSVAESLELVEEDDQFTHLLMLDEATNPEDALNAFKFDEKYETNEDKYKGLSKEILGSDGSDSDGSGSGSGSNSDSNDSGGSDAEKDDEKATAGDIIDNTETNMIALRRTIYLTINSSLDYEECAHKLMKMQLKPGQEIELCHMFLDCCAEQRTYEKFYGLLAQRFCAINKIYIEPFEEIFRDTYQTTHRLDTNRLRNVSKFFAHLLFTDAISWDVLECIKLNEDDTTSSSRIFIKILFQELAEYMGLGKLNSKLKDEVLTESLAGLFPKDNPRNTRFAINFFTSIGLGGLTDDLRQFLKNAPKSVPAINLEILANKPASSSSSSSSSSTTTSSSSSLSTSESSSSSSSSSSNSDSESSESDHNKKKRKLSKKSSTKKKKPKSKKGQQLKKSNNKQKKKIEKKTKRKTRRRDNSSPADSSSSDSESSGSSDSQKRKKKYTKNKSKSSKSEKKEEKVEVQDSKAKRKNGEHRSDDYKRLRMDDYNKEDSRNDRRERDRRREHDENEQKAYRERNNYEHVSNKSRNRERSDHFDRDRDYHDKRSKNGRQGNADEMQRSKSKSSRNGSKERG